MARFQYGMVAGWLLVVFLLVNSTAQAQPFKNFKLVDSVGITIKDFTTDNLGNIFLVNEDQQVKKLNDKLDSIAVYNDIRRYGDLAHIDASNPLKVLLYYQDFLTIVVLDRLLNVRNTVDLRQSDILQCSAITNSYDNNIWLFDELDNKVKKIDESGKRLLESADFRVLFDAPPHPQRLEDFNKYLYAYDSAKGLLVMDYYGSYKKLVPLKTLKNIQGVDKGIFATDKNGLLYMEPDWLEPKTFPVTQAMQILLKAKKVRFFAQRCYALHNGKVYVYQSDM